MKKGYTVTLSLRYIEDVEIETEEEDEEKIKIEALENFVYDIKGMCGAGDVLDGMEAVKIERNYSEHPKAKTTPTKKLKDYIVCFFSRSSEICVTVPAVDETEAEEKAE